VKSVKSIINITVDNLNPSKRLKKSEGKSCNCKRR